MPIFSMSRRITIGLACVIAVSIELALEFLTPNLGVNLPLIVSVSGLRFFVAFAAGGYVAQTRFLVPALLCVILMWLFWISLSLDFRVMPRAELLDVVGRNLDTLAFWAFVSGIGAFFGMRLHSWVGTRRNDFRHSDL